MKKLFILLLTFAAFSAAQAQTKIVTYRIEGGPDTFFVVDSNVRIFPGGTRVVEEVWRPVVGRDSLKSYLVTLETLATSAEAVIDIKKQNRNEAKDEIKRIKKELDKPKGNGAVQNRTVLQPVMVLENPALQPASLAPGTYIWDGYTWTPQAKVKKVKTSTTKKKS